MAMRLEKSGGLIFVHGSADPPVRKKCWEKVPGGLGAWLALVAFVAAEVGAPHIASAWPVVAHTVKGFVVGAP